MGKKFYDLRILYAPFIYLLHDMYTKRFCSIEICYFAQDLWSNSVSKKWKQRFKVLTATTKRWQQQKSYLSQQHDAEEPS